jgi:hypothetical protein
MEARVDVYLLPAIVGGGLGDIEEVLCAGRHLARAGFPCRLYRSPGRPLPPGVDGPWDRPTVRRVASLAPAGPAALTVAPSWGITARVRRREEERGRGPWTEEAEAIERQYGSDRTVHVSFEEFGRTLTPEAATVERFREGGVRARAIPARVAAARKLGEVAAFERAYREARALDRPNVAHLLTTFRRDPSFARRFPEIVQTGPLWPRAFPRGRARSRPGREWVWYASPASSERIAPAVVAGLARRSPRTRLVVRTSRTWASPPSGPSVELRSTPLPLTAWRRRFARAAVRIVTGSRSLLEAIEVGGPFLYFNGALGTGAARRRHRPEKIVSFLAAARQRGWPPDLRRDLSDFARGRRVEEIVARASANAGGWRRFPRGIRPVGFRPPLEDAGAVLVGLARALSVPGAEARRTVESLRRRSNR